MWPQRHRLEGGTRSQGMLASSRSREEARHRFSPGASSRGWFFRHLTFGPVILTLDFWTPELLKNKCLLFEEKKNMFNESLMAQW